MVDTQHFCLRWNNYQSSITSAFENLRDDEDFVDVTLACDGKSLKAHRVVLSACSPYFRELLKSTPCKHPVIVLQDVAWTDLHALVEFIYHGEVNVHQRSLSSFLKTAEVLRVSGLTQQHGEDRGQLAQVQSLITSQHSGGGAHTTPSFGANHHGTSFTEKLVEDALFTASYPSPPHGATVNQLLRRAAMQHRRDRRVSADPETEQKRARSEHIIGNNNNNNELLHPPQTQPADFSPSAMKQTNNSSALNLNLNSKKDIDGNNGISSTERENSPCSRSPTLLTPGGGHRVKDETIKNEPMELLCSTNQDENSNDSTDMGNDNGPNNLPQGPHSGSSGGGDHDDHDSPIGPYLTPSESKLFATAAGSFNFSMAALAADPTGLGGLNQSLQSNDSLAGTSQGGDAAMLMMDVSRGGDYDHHHYGEKCKICGKILRNRITLRRHIKDLHYVQTEEFWCKICNRCYRTKNSLVVHTCLDDFRCQPCNKSLSSLTRLKRHIQNVHMRPSREPVCNICKRVYSSLNSLRNHKSIYHRNVKNIKEQDIISPHHSFYL